MSLKEKFLKYVSFDTQSDEDSLTSPSSEKQKLLGKSKIVIVIMSLRVL